MSYFYDHKDRRREHVLRHLDAYASVMQRTDRILSGKTVTVELTDAPHIDAPAWSTGSAIFLQREMMVDLYNKYSNDPVKFLLKFKGANYHELCHVEYTPRRGDEILSWIDTLRYDVQPLYRMAFNYLEDQRIEMMFVSTYTASIRYFEAAVYEWVMRNPAAVANAHVLTRGRLYLDITFRKTVRDAFANKHGKPLALDVDDIVDQYLKVVYPTNLIKARSLLQRMVKVLEVVFPPQQGTPQSGPGTCVHAVQVEADSGRVSKSDQQKAQAKCDEFDWDHQPDSDHSDHADPGDDKSPGGDEKQDGDGTGNGSEPESDSTQGKGSTSGSSSSQSKSKGAGKDMTPAPEAVFDAIESLVDQAARDAMQDILKDDGLKQDVKNVQRAVHSIVNGQDEVNGTLATNKPMAPPKNAARLSSRVKLALRQLQLDLEPSWQKRENYGSRINMRRWMMHQPHETDLFDRWDQGQEDEGGVELVLCVDLSGSMSGNMKDLSTALWILKRAFDELGFRTTVIGYSERHYVLYKPSTKVPRATVPLFGAHASTNPESALVEALRILRTSQQANRVLVSLTDGQWGYATKAEAAVHEMNKLNVHTMLLGLDSAVALHGTHGHTMGHDMNDLDELPKIIQKLVASILRSVRTV